MPVLALIHAPPEQRRNTTVVPLPSIPPSSPYRVLIPPFPLARRNMRIAHDVCAQWLISHSPESRPVVVPALRRGYYLPGEAQQAYRLYLLRHYLDRDLIGLTLARLARHACSAPVLITGPDCYAETLAHAVRRLSEKPSYDPDESV